MPLFGPALAIRGARKEATAWADTVQLHRTYYTVVTHRHPSGSGTHQLVHEHIAKSRSRITGQPLFGHMSASELWLGHGPVHTERPPGLQTLREYVTALDKAPGPELT